MAQINVSGISILTHRLMYTEHVQIRTELSPLMLKDWVCVLVWSADDMILIFDLEALMAGCCPCDM